MVGSYDMVSMVIEIIRLYVMVLLIYTQANQAATLLIGIALHCKATC